MFLLFTNLASKNNKFLISRFRKKKKELYAKGKRKPIGGSSIFTMSRRISIRSCPRKVGKWRREKTLEWSLTGHVLLFCHIKAIYACLNKLRSTLQWHDWINLRSRVTACCDLVGGKYIKFLRSIRSLSFPFLSFQHTGLIFLSSTESKQTIRQIFYNNSKHRC